MEPSESAFGNFEGREDAIRSLRCMNKPWGCGRSIEPSEMECWPEIDIREYRITGQCNSCQQQVYADMERLEEEYWRDDPD